MTDDDRRVFAAFVWGFGVGVAFSLALFAAC
jgi:hypothetical protein